MGERETKPLSETRGFDSIHRKWEWASTERWINREKMCHNPPPMAQQEFSLVVFFLILPIYVYIYIVIKTFGFLSSLPTQQLLFPKYMPQHCFPSFHNLGYFFSFHFAYSSYYFWRSLNSSFVWKGEFINSKASVASLPIFLLPDTK